MWTVRKSEHVFRDQWISVRADDCVTTAGVEVSPYYIFEFRDFVHALVVDQTHHLVLVRQYRHGLGKFTLELPGGVMNPGEAEPTQTAIREVAEETGYTSNDVILTASLSIDPARVNNKVHLVVMRGAVKSKKRNLDLTEDIEVILVPSDEAFSLAITGQIENAAHAAMIMIGLSSGRSKGDA